MGALLGNINTCNQTELLLQLGYELRTFHSNDAGF
jgi:hypothetical protein